MEDHILSAHAEPDSDMIFRCSDCAFRTSVKNDFGKATSKIVIWDLPSALITLMKKNLSIRMEQRLLTRRGMICRITGM